MKAVYFRGTALRYLLMRFLSSRSPRFIYGKLCLAKFEDIPEPSLIDEEWVKIKSTASGICGSDIGGLSGHESTYLDPFVSREFVLGHENVGIIEKVGRKVKGLKKGDRVISIPYLSCRQRGIKNLCEYCRKGDYSLCENINEGKIPAGLGIGWNKATSGGWAEYFVCHYSNVIKIPDSISDEEAVMVDSFSCALHGVINNMPKENDAILVYGCGTMGLNIIMAIRALGLRNKIIAIYSRDFQKEMAAKIGANVLLDMKDDLLKKIAKLTNAKMYFPRIGNPVLEGGVNIIYDCVSTSGTINNSLRFLKGGGKLVMVATASSRDKIDFAPVWFRELSVIGTSQQGLENYKGALKSTYEITVDMIKQKKISLKKFVTHKFPLSEFKKALKTAVSKKEPTIKVMLYNE